MGRTIVEFPPQGPCAHCGGAIIAADLDAYQAIEWRCMLCGRPPTPPPPPDLVHAEPIIKPWLRKREWR
jgi:hypothetical protein